MATSPKDFIFDAWTAMSFKRALGAKTQPGVAGAIAPSWTGEHQRRLTAYKVLQSYYDNAARLFLNKTDQTEVDNHREYGDAAVIVDTVTAALLGEDQEIFVEHADEFTEGDDDETTPDDENTPEAQAAFELQEWLRSWAWTLERMGLKMLETERNAVRLGDGVFTVGWSPDKGRVRCRVFDPGFYFPVLSDGNEDDFPERVHIAWEVEDPALDAAGEIRIRRITWELVPSEPWTPTYAEAGAPPATKRCLMSDGTFMLKLGKEHDVDALDPNRAVYETYEIDGETFEWRDLDLEIDFMPVLHLPNTVALSNHYGRSTLQTILQILDDLSNADTDLQAASGTTGKPPIAVKGAAVSTAPTYKAGEVWAVGEGGVEVIDTSRSLDALLKYVDALLKRLSINGRVPDSVLGRIEGDLSSGIELRLRFGPLESMIREMRLVRDEKYPLLLKFVWRIAIQNGQEDVPDQWYASRVEFGRFLPSDQAAAVEIVSRLLEQKAVSTETATGILIAAGFEIDDASAEVARIESRDFAGAVALLDATGDEQAVRDYLQLEGPPPEPEEPPAPNPDQPAGLPPVQPPPGIPVAEA